ncbi:MAG: UPF0182 family protein, partial [Acidobacteria bacterium]|nr:UPF0182 family protein [Acidobacteriota bacterium]
MPPPLPPRIALILTGATIFFLLPSLAWFYSEWLWFGEVGYQHVLERTLAAKAAAALLAGGVAFLILFGNLSLALALLNQPYLVLGASVEGRPIVLDRAQLRWLAAGGAALVGLLIGLSASGRWLGWLQFLHATPFGVHDPIFGRDVAFYVFQLPVLEFSRSLLVVVIVLSLLACAGLNVLTGGVSLDARRGLTATSYARRHLSLLAGALFLLMAFGAYLEMPGLLVRPGTIHGASYVDVHARVPFLIATVAVLVLGAGLAIVHAFSTARWPLLLAGSAYLAVTIAGAVYAAIVQRVVVAPNEQVREQPFIVHNIVATRKAFGLDRVEERQLTGDAALTRADIVRNAATFENVRLWDHQPLLDTFGQIQEIRSYYDFTSVDNDRYVIDGQYRQIMLSARELNSETLQNRTWVNERLTFTHGYGLTLGPVNQVTSEGLPVLFIKDIPPASVVDLEVREPSIYFGELSSDYVLVKTGAREFHFPKGDDNVYTAYSGTGGVPMGSFLRRLLFAVRFRASDILLTDVVTPESRILFHRRLRGRIATLAPFLVLDRDPYLVIADGRLFWLQDAYTTTTRYPYATPARDGLNYIRNAVKVVVD